MLGFSTKRTFEGRLEKFRDNYPTHILFLRDSITNYHVVWFGLFTSATGVRKGESGHGGGVSMQQSPDWRTPDWEPEPLFWCASNFALLLFLSDPDRFGKCWGKDPAAYGMWYRKCLQLAYRVTSWNERINSLIENEDIGHVKVSVSPLNDPAQQLFLESMEG